jgi:hypothetical protein
LARFKQFDRYAHKVFKLPDFLEGIEDGRLNPEIDIQRIIKGLIYGFSLRLKAISTIERECREGVLKSLVGAISDDTISYGLDHVDSLFLHDGWTRINKIIKRNGMLRKNAYGGMIVGVVDAIETISSYSRCCDRCLKREVTVRSEPCIQYYHRMVVLSLSGFDHPIPLALEQMKPGEGEVDCAIRLLERVVGDLGGRYLDVVIGDALYCTPAFFDACNKLGLSSGAVLKDNQHALLQEAECLKRSGKPSLSEVNQEKEFHLWDHKSVDWPTADQDVRVIYADRKERIVEQIAGKKVARIEKKRNVFAFSKTLDDKDPRLLYRIGCHRQDIDASLFQDLTQNCFLKHSTLHYRNAYENYLILRIIAFMLIAFFFHRHINSRRILLVDSPTIIVKQIYVSMIESLAPT